MEEFDAKVAQRLRKIREQSSITITELNRQIGISKSNLSKYFNGELRIPLKVLTDLGKVFGFSLDNLVADGEETIMYCNEQNELVEKYDINYKKIGQKYVLYYFPTSTSYFNLSSDSEIEQTEPLSAVMRITPGAPPYTVDVVFNIVGNDRLALFLDNDETPLFELMESRTHKTQIADETYYTGTMVLTQENIQISLTGNDSNNKALLLFINPQSQKCYQGGLGIITSISRGRHKYPTTNKIIMSSHKLNTGSDNFKNALSLMKLIPNIDTADKEYNNFIEFLTKRAITLAEFIFKSQLENEEKETAYDVFRGCFERNIKNFIDNKLITVSKVDDFADDQIYRILKQVTTVDEEALTKE